MTLPGDVDARPLIDQVGFADVIVQYGVDPLEKP
jgi:hypothetical protein